MLSHISIDLVINLFNERVVTHNQLCQLLENNNIQEFVDIAIGIDESIPNGNYSASEHSLGERIISSNHDVYNRIFHFAQEVYQAQDRLNIPRIIRGFGFILSKNQCWFGNSNNAKARYLLGCKCKNAMDSSIYK